MRCMAGALMMSGSEGRGGDQGNVFDTRLLHSADRGGQRLDVSQIVS